ncbi:MAG: chromosome partitioning protein ParA [Actinomycetota bacterium]
MKQFDSNVSDTPLANELADNNQRLQRANATPVKKPNATRIFTVSNQKGGVGKTTTAVNIAAALAIKGLNVLVIDLDPQGNASTALGVEHHQGVAGAYEVLIGGIPMSQAIKPSSTVANLYCLPATIDLAAAEMELFTNFEDADQRYRLRRALSEFLDSVPAEYCPDYVFIDCPPSLGLLTVNAFAAALEVLIPIQCEYYALEGLSQLLGSVDRIKQSINPKLKLSTILLTMFDSRTRLSTQVADEVRNHFANETLNAVIPRAVRVSEAPSYQQTVLTYDKNSSGAIAYLEAAIELANKDV